MEIKGQILRGVFAMSLRRIFLAHSPESLKILGLTGVDTKSHMAYNH